MNRFLASGRLATDPQLKQTGENPVCKMRLAIARQRRQGKEPGAVFIDLVAFGRLGAVCAEHLQRGSRVAVSARLEQSRWTDPQGKAHSRHELIAQEVEFLDRPPGWAPPAQAPTAGPSPVDRPAPVAPPTPIAASAAVGEYEAIAS